MFFLLTTLVVVQLSGAQQHLHIDDTSYPSQLTCIANILGIYDEVMVEARFRGHCALYLIPIF